MIDLTEKSLPNTIQVQGRDFSIHTDFRIWMRFCIEFQRWKNAGCRGVLDIAYLFSVEPPAFYCVEDYTCLLYTSGLRSIDYTSGRTYQLDTAARMAIRTANSQLAGQISMHYIEETDTDLVEVSAHWGARPEHAEWQGKIYSRSGKNKKYPNFSACHYGEVDGLKGINCRHDFYPFFEGVSEPNTWPDEPKPQEYHGKTYNYYQATQKQRKMAVSYTRLFNKG